MFRSILDTVLQDYRDLMEDWAQSNSRGTREHGQRGVEHVTEAEQYYKRLKGGGDLIILTKADTDLCLGSQELKPCPFCGYHAMSSGQKTPNGRAIKWSIQCMGSNGLIPNCMAQVTGTHEDQNEARRMAVERWNKRT